MPHNLYLHSSIVQHRANWDSSKKVVLFATYDTIIALSLAFLVNCSILIVAGSSLYKPDQPIDDEKVASLKDATGLLENVLGSLGSTV
jgi:manganese transport protein